MTLVALPLFKIELSYLVRHGRRWTVLEQLLLWALSQEPRNLASLCRECAMPERIVVEALINLLKVGWIELTTIDQGGVNQAVLFTANARGRGVARADEPPYAFDIEKRFSALYVDRLTTSILREEQIQVRHRDQIDRSSTLVLRPDYEKYDASPAHFFENLGMRADDQFERPLDRRIISAAQYAMLEVIGDQVIGLPEDVPAKLVEVVLRRLPMNRHLGRDRIDGQPTARATSLMERSKFGPADIAETDLLIGGRDHRKELRRVLRDAKSVVYIHSTFIGGIIEAFIPDFVAAAERDVEVILLWGERRDPLKEEPNQSEVKGSLAYRNIPAEWRERIRLMRDPTGSHAKLLLADSGLNGAFEAVVGSCNWLSADYSGLEISVRLREPHLVEGVAGALADLARGPSLTRGREVTSLLKIRDRCSRAAPLSSSGQGRAMLVFDEEHYAAVRDARNECPASVNVGCDLFGPAGETTVLIPLQTAEREDDARIRIFFKRPTEGFETELQRTIDRFGTERTDITQVGHLHGKFMSWNDQNAVITSFNWLSGSIVSAHASATEVGVLVRDPILVGVLHARLSAFLAIDLANAVPGGVARLSSVTAEG